MADPFFGQVVALDVPALFAVLQPVGLDPALGELVLVLLVVAELEHPALGDRLVDEAGDLGVAAAGRGDLQPLLGGVVAERLDDFPARGLQVGLRQVVAEEVDRRHQRLRLQRQQAGGAGEVVAVGLGVDLDLVAEDFRVEDVGAAAEVDDVQQLDVLAQLLRGQLEPVAQLGDLQPLALFRRFDQHPGEGDQAGEALGPDRRLAAAVGAGALRLLFAAGGRRPRPVGSRSRGARSSRPRRFSASSRRSSGASTCGVLAPAQDPGDQLALGGVGGLEDAAFAGGAVGLLHVAELAVGAVVALDQPGDPLADEDLRRPLRLPQLPVGAAAVVAAVEVLGRGEVVLGLGGVADLALDPREAEDAHRVALVRVADQVELAAAEDEVEGVDLALLGLAPLHRVVGELDRLAAGDRGLDLGEALGEVAAAGGGGHRHLDRGALALGASGFGCPQATCCRASRSGSA